MPSEKKRKGDFKTGTKATIWRGLEDPWSDFLTKQVAAVLACGAQLIGKKGFIHIAAPVQEDQVDEDADQEEAADPELDHAVTWIFKAKGVQFDPIDSAEKMSIADVAEHFEDLDWIQANPNHPISYMRAFLIKMEELRETIDRLGPCVTVERNGGTAIVPEGTPPEEVDEIFRELERSRFRKKT